MSQTFFPLDSPIEITPSSTGWVSVNLSSYIPEGATGVVLHFVNTSSSSLQVGARKPGDTVLAANYMHASIHTWCMAGVDSNRYVDIYVGDTTYIDVYLVAYTKSGVTFLNNAVNVSPSTLGSWQDVNLSSYCPNAIGAIFIISGTGTAYTFGLRKKGSTDNRYSAVYYYNLMGFVVGCDSSQVVQAYSGSTNLKFYLIGYITDGAVFNTNASNVTPGTTGTWVDLSALPSQSVMGFFEMYNSSSTTNLYYGLRKNGSSEDIYKFFKARAYGIVACDGDGIIEGKYSGGSFYLIGYATVPTPTEATEYLRSQAQVAEMATQYLLSQMSIASPAVAVPLEGSSPFLIAKPSLRSAIRAKAN